MSTCKVVVKPLIYPLPQSFIRHSTATPKSESKQKQPKVKPSAGKAQPEAKDFKPKSKPLKVSAASKPTSADVQKYKVADDSGVKRGVVREFVDAAKTMKTFTKDELVAKMSAYGAERMTRYFYYCTAKSIFAVAS